MTPEVIGEIERLFVGAARTDDRDRALQIGKRPDDAKQSRRVRQIAKLRWVLWTKRAHQPSARGKIRRHNPAIDHMPIQLLSNGLEFDEGDVYFRGIRGIIIDTWR